MNIENIRYKQLNYHARRPNNNLLPFGVSLVVAAGKASPKDPRTRFIPGSTDSLAELRETKSKRYVAEAEGRTRVITLM